MLSALGNTATVLSLLLATLVYFDIKPSTIAGWFKRENRTEQMSTVPVSLPNPKSKTLFVLIFITWVWCGTTTYKLAHTEDLQTLVPYWGVASNGSSCEETVHMAMLSKYAKRYNLFVVGIVDDPRVDRQYDNRIAKSSLFSITDMDTLIQLPTLDILKNALPVNTASYPHIILETAILPKEVGLDRINNLSDIAASNGKILVERSFQMQAVQLMQPPAKAQ